MPRSCEASSTRLPARTLGSLPPPVQMVLQDHGDVEVPELKVEAADGKRLLEPPYRQVAFSLERQTFSDGDAQPDATNGAVLWSG